ncbi:hypothetical protein [Rhodocyclus tenuis]|uniref:Uncharacterized protein n=1 Tax=Rhodocyclus tenuis TaxID=1066 RepID=A0A840G7K1_RHOTE|nr:hypothetical protein [Rhodocyclus tenuis]MBB4247391.1 hypothetical protein [Rhodocyclus tenuis]MBK1681218.1 hypothetical protein [Rhodocyclus tenuis]
MRRTQQPNTRSPAPIRKERSISFARFPPDQVAQAGVCLADLPRLDVAPLPERRAVDVAYDLREYTLRSIEASVEDHGFHLDNTLLSKMKRALIHYVEETELHNLGAPELKTKRSQNEVYTQAWDRQPHGDSDETPPEWRDYR